jgi:hypothetical protein
MPRHSSRIALPKRFAEIPGLGRPGRLTVQPASFGRNTDRFASSFSYPTPAGDWLECRSPRALQPALSSRNAWARSMRALLVKPLAKLARAREFELVAGDAEVVVTGHCKSNNFCIPFGA